MFFCIYANIYYYNTTVKSKKQLTNTHTSLGSSGREKRLPQIKTGVEKITEVTKPKNYKTNKPNEKNILMNEFFCVKEEQSVISVTSVLL